MGQRDSHLRKPNASDMHNLRSFPNLQEENLPRLLLQSSADRLEKFHRCHQTSQSMLRLRYKKDTLVNQLCYERNRNKFFYKRLRQLDKLLCRQRERSKNDFNQLVGRLRSTQHEAGAHSVITTSQDHPLISEEEQEDDDAQNICDEIQAETGIFAKYLKRSSFIFKGTLPEVTQKNLGSIKVTNGKYTHAPKATSPAEAEEEDSINTKLTSDSSVSSINYSQFSNSQLTSGSENTTIPKQRRTKLWLERIMDFRRFGWKTKSPFTKFANEPYLKSSDYAKEAKKSERVTLNFRNLNSFDSVVFHKGSKGRKESEKEYEKQSSLKPSLLNQGDLNSGGIKSVLSKSQGTENEAELGNSEREDGIEELDEVKFLSVVDELKVNIRKSRACWSEAQKSARFLSKLKYNVHHRIERMLAEKEAIMQEILQICEIKSSLK